MTDKEQDKQDKQSNKTALVEITITAKLDVEVGAETDDLTPDVQSKITVWDLTNSFQLFELVCQRIMKDFQMDENARELFRNEKDARNVFNKH